LVGEKAHAVTSKTLQRLLVDLPNLSKAELEQVRARVEFLLKSKAVTKRDNEDDWLTAGLIYELGREGLLYKGINWHRIAPKEYDKISRSTRDLLLERAQRQLTLPEKYALGRVAAEALIQMVRSWKFEDGEFVLGLKSMLGQIGRTLEAFEHAYPGYLKCGRVGLLINSRVVRGDK